MNTRRDPEPSHPVAGTPTSGSSAAEQARDATAETEPSANSVDASAVSAPVPPPDGGDDPNSISASTGLGDSDEHTDGDDEEADNDYTAPYKFDDADIEVGASLVDAAADGATADHAVVTAIGQRAGAAAVRGPLQRELGFVFMYRLTYDRVSARPSPGATLEPAEASSDYFLTGIRQTSDDVAALWERLSGVAQADRALARIHDLLFVRRYGNVGDHGSAAISHYRAASADASEHDQVPMLLRAWTIARKMHRHSDESAVRTTMWALVQQHVDRGDGGAPGITLPLLTALTDPPRDGSAISGEPDIDEVLNQLAGKYTHDHLVDRVAAMQRGRAAGDPATIEAINRRRVQARLDRAAAAPMVQLRMHFLDQAARLGRALGVTDLADHAVTEMQNIDPSTLEWAHITASAPAPTAAYEGFLQLFDASGQWADGLREWFATPPPSGDYRDNVRAARRHLDDSIVRRLFPNRSHGSHGLPQRTSGTNEALDDDVRLYEQNHAQVMGGLLGIALRRIRALAPDLTAADLTEWITREYGTNGPLASRLARSIVLFWEGDFDESAHTVAPAIEAAARGLLRELDEPLYRVEKARTVGGFPGLGNLLPRLHARGFDKSWQRFLDVLLLPSGYNLRNVIAHGLAARLGEVDAALLIRAAAVVALIAAPDSAHRDAQELQATLGRPVRPVPRTIRQRLRAAARAACWELRRR